MAVVFTSSEGPPELAGKIKYVTWANLSDRDIVFFLLLTRIF